MLFHMSEARPYVAHARYMTKGKICKENIHLFEQGDWLVAMNGTISGFADATANDTRLAMDILKTIPRKKDKIAFMEKWEARFLCVNRKTNEVIRTGTWIEKEGVQYSKNNVLETFRKKEVGYAAGAYYNDHYNYAEYSSSPPFSGKSNKQNSILKAKLDDCTYVLKDNMWVTKSSLTKGLYGTKEDTREFGILKDSGTSKVKEGVITTTRASNVIVNKSLNVISTEANGFVLVSVYGYLLSNYKCREILDRASFIQASRSVAKLSMIEHMGTSYMLPESDKDSKIVNFLTYQLKINEFKELMAAACSPNYVIPDRKSVVLDDLTNTTVVSYVFVLNARNTVDSISSGTRVSISKKLLEKDRTLSQ